MSKFIWAPDEPLLLGRAPLRPRTARDLLRHLDVAAGTPQQKQDAVRFWLRDNEPDPLLLVSLRAAGLPTTLVDISQPKSPLHHVSIRHATVLIVTKIRPKSTSSLV